MSNTVLKGPEVRWSIYSPYMIVLWIYQATCTAVPCSDERQDRDGKLAVIYPDCSAEDGVYPGKKLDLSRFW